MRAPRVLTTLVCIALTVASANAMVGGAAPADQTVARHVVLIVGGRNLCTGVAIAPDLVLTAAHCVQENAKYRLVTFESRRSAGLTVASVAPHPQFSPRADAPDLALVKVVAQPLAKLIPVAFSDRRVPPAVGDRFIVAGFGVAVEGDRKSAGKLRTATLVVTDRPSSQQLSLIDPQKLGEAAGLGVCHGDSGGPALDEHDGALVGIVSWSAKTGGEPVCGFVTGVIPLARYRALDTRDGGKTGIATRAMIRSATALACMLAAAPSATAMVGGAPPAEDFAAERSRRRPARKVRSARASPSPATRATAAHCVPPGADYKLIELAATRQPVLRDIARIERHPEFDAKAAQRHRVTADIALLKIPSALKIAPALLAPRTGPVAAGDRFVVAGSGVAVRGDGKTGGTVRDGNAGRDRPARSIADQACRPGHQRRACRSRKPAPAIPAHRCFAILAAPWP